MSSPTRFDLSVVVVASAALPPSAWYTWFIKATSHSTIFRACKYAIKDTDDVLPAKNDCVARIGNCSFEFCPLHASHA